MNNTIHPAVQAEIISAPAIHQMTVTSVGTNMFSLNLNVVLVVRIPESVGDTANAAVQPTTSSASVSTSDMTYSDGSQPAPGGEIAAFQDFLNAHGYPPPSRQSLSEWVQSQS